MKKIVGTLLILLLTAAVFLSPAGCTPKSISPDFGDSGSVIKPVIRENIRLPDEKPVIFMQLSRVMGGTNDEVSIYDDGTVISLKERNLRQMIVQIAPERAWRTGTISAGNVTGLFEFLESVNLNELEGNYSAVDPEAKSGVISDLQMAVTVRNNNRIKNVVAFGYSTPDSERPNKTLPWPLGEIYLKLIDIAENKTKEIYCEELQ